MKLVQELIGYLYGRGQLDDDDLGVLSKKGFYPQDIQPETQSDDEDASAVIQIFPISNAKTNITVFFLPKTRQNIPKAEN